MNEDRIPQVYLVYDMCGEIQAIFIYEKKAEYYASTIGGSYKSIDVDDVHEYI